MNGETADMGAADSRSVGEQLKAKRIQDGLGLDDVAARTRIPLRHLEAIEQSDFSALPSTTYAMGFAKAYARAIGLDEVEIGRQLRGELATGYSRPALTQPYEIEDPTRVPPRGLAIGGVVVAVLVLVGIAIWYSSAIFAGGDGAPAPAPASTAPAPTVSAPVPPPSATPAVEHVTLTATGEVWVRVYDADRKTLFEKIMKPGDRFDVPVDANQPMINVGRPEFIQVTINGASVDPLGPPARAVKDVGISAAALRARGQPDAGSAAPSPAPSPTTTP